MDRVMGNIGPMELVVVLVIALVVLGPKRLPEAGKSIGKGIREFKSAIGGATGSTESRLESWNPDEDEDLFAEERRAEEARRFEEQQGADEAAARGHFEPVAPSEPAPGTKL